MNVRIVTSRFGGPFQWGCGLSRALRLKGYRVNQTSTLAGYVKNMVFPDCDMVHTTVPILCEWRKRPIVVTVKGDFTSERSVWQRLYPKLINQAAAVTVPSNYIKERVSIEKAIVIPNAVFPEDAKVVSHKTDGRMHLVTVMNFYFKDKADGCVRMLELLKGGGVGNLLQIIVGEGTYLPSVREYSKNCELDVRFSGYLPNPYMALYNSDVFLYYSHHDNFPNVILEAMASGLPVLTNKVGAVKEMIESGVDGLIAEDDEQYVGYLKRLVSDTDLRKRLGVEARRKVERCFNWNILVDRYIEIYEKVLSTGG